MSGGKKLLGGLLALGISLAAVTAPPVIQPSKAQTQDAEQQELRTCNEISVTSYGVICCGEIV